MRSTIGLAAIGLGTVLLAQEPQTPAPSLVEGPTFRVAVDAVRIDAVVTDKNGDIVRNLSAGDFDILQDGKKQKVTFAQFVPVSAAAVAPPPARPLKGTAIAGTPPLPAAGPVRREQIQRTIALVVDDLGLSVESLYYVKRGLHDFIDRGVQPNDLVALDRSPPRQPIPRRPARSAVRRS